jgi:nitrate/TMAO reductase-like tetraheme cytochrome c subunit
MKKVRTSARIAQDIARSAKECSTCLVEKPFQSFDKSAKSPDGFYFRCKECRASLTDRSKERERKLKSKYKINQVSFRELLKKQNNKCAICFSEDAGGKYSTMKVDHCHTTGQVRGLLCQQCNLGLGHFKDNVEFLSKAIEYLNENRT